jgi:hypothetical protein
MSAADAVLEERRDRRPAMFHRALVTGGQAVDRMAVGFVALAAALWVSDAYFRPALAHQLSASQIVLV